MKLSRTKLYMRLLFGALCMVLLAFCSSVSFAASQVDISQQEETISVPLKDWNKLKTNLIEADASIKNSSLSLSEAQSLTVKQATELQELKIINEEREKDLIALKDINKKQGEELAKASEVITEQAGSLAKASESLEELKVELKNNRRTEQRLRRQRDTWAISNAALFLAGALRR